MIRFLGAQGKPTPTRLKIVQSPQRKTLPTLELNQGPWSPRPSLLPYTECNVERHVVLLTSEALTAALYC